MYYEAALLCGAEGGFDGGALGGYFVVGAVPAEIFGEGGDVLWSEI